MCSAIVHRGPDDEGTFTSGPVGIGMRRLSIIDLASGHQPISNEDGNLTIVFNGEIYNHLAIRRVLEQRGHRFATSSDTECIVHAYEEYGADCVQHLNGMFAFAIWDSRRRELFIARDRVGIKPLYIHQTTETVRFASEVKALLSDPDVPRELEKDAFLYFFRYGYLPAADTLLRSVKQLPPAHWMMVRADGVTIRRYWSLSYADPLASSDDEFADALQHSLKKAVTSQLISDVPLGAFLSGGLDSSSIVQMMSEDAEAVSTYAIGFGGSDSFHSELSDARFVADLCHTRHHEILVKPDVVSLLPKLVRHLDQPLADSSFVVTYLVSELARQTVKVIISGVGGDELFGGYRRYLGPSLDRVYDHVPAPIRALLARAASHLPVDRGSTVKNVARLGRAFLTSHGKPPFERYDQAVRLVSEDVLASLIPGVPRRESDFDAMRRTYFESAPASDPLAQMLALDFHTSLPDSLLLLTDRMSMATSLEARVPFLDHEFVALAAQIPSRLKIRGTSLRHIQKKSMQGRLPARVLTKKKRGFGCPTGAWFRGELKPLLLDSLAPDRVRRRGLFDPAVVSQVIDAHFSFREDYSDLLLALLTFELWHSQVLSPS
jgi:asparagine synthase (glutamine-hydrolysing)